MRIDIKKCINNNNIDYIIVEFPQMLGNITSETMKSKKIILIQQNIEWKAMKNNSTIQTNIIAKCLYKFESSRLKKLEACYYRTNEIFLYVFISKADKFYFENQYCLYNTMLLPPGIGHHNKSGVAIENNILFVGKMSYSPNIYGAMWVVKEIIPLIIRFVPDVKFYIVGKDPAKEILNLSSDNVIITGTVENVSLYYDIAKLVVVPIFNGGGVNIKIFEAMSFNKYIISTDKGIIGTDFLNGVHLKVANRANEFAEACISGLLHPELYEQISKNGYEKVVKDYSWDKNVKVLENHMLKSSLYNDCAVITPCRT
jgi:glycosyltransferase involved in cell wall biosynthesis